MLTINIPAVEQWDSFNEQFIYSDPCTIVLEHSLLSLSMWESKWKKPFLSKQNHTIPETIDYIRCMTVNDIDDNSVYSRLTDSNIKDVDRYINDPMTATVFFEANKAKEHNKTITSEVIYYWMVTYGIPFECEKWHLNRLLTLIKVCNLENKPAKKRSSEEISRQYSELNRKRKNRLHTKG